MENIGRVSMAVEVDGQPYYVALPQDRLKILVGLAQSLSDDGQLHVAKAPVGTAFYTLESKEAANGA